MHSIHPRRAFAGLSLAFRANGSHLHEAVLEEQNGGLRRQRRFEVHCNVSGVEGHLKGFVEARTHVDLSLLKYLYADIAASGAVPSTTSSGP